MYKEYDSSYSLTLRSKKFPYKQNNDLDKSLENDMYDLTFQSEE